MDNAFRNLSNEDLVQFWGKEANAEILRRLNEAEILRRMGDGWVSVEYGLPDTDGEYLVLHEGEQEIARFRATKRMVRVWSDSREYHPDYGESDISKEVTHWMPLPPTPPKEDK